MSYCSYYSYYSETGRIPTSVTAHASLHPCPLAFAQVVNVVHVVRVTRVVRVIQVIKFVKVYDLNGVNNQIIEKS